MGTQEKSGWNRDERDLEQHQLWLKGQGQKFCRSSCNIRLSGDINLSKADLPKTGFSTSNLNGANFSEANLQSCILNSMSLRGVNFRGADLREAFLMGSDLTGADFTGAKLTGASFEETLLGDTIGLDDQKVPEEIERVPGGYFVYKAFWHRYAPPSHWDIRSESVIEDSMNLDPRETCGRGINVATLKWCAKHTAYTSIWKCFLDEKWPRIVPFGAGGKFRVEKLQLITTISRGYP